VGSAPTEECIDALVPAAHGRAEQACTERSPSSHYAALTASPHIRSGSNPYQAPSCDSGGHRAPRRMGPISCAVYCSHGDATVTHPLGLFLSSVSTLSALYLLESYARGHHAGFQVAPQRNQQPAGHSPMVMRRIRPLRVPTRWRNQTLLSSW
jgi:hypothetical protein